MDLETAGVLPTGSKAACFSWPRVIRLPRTEHVGVPQRSVLGPMLFSLYVQPVGDIIRRHGLQFHHYADDLQLMLTFELNAQSLLEAMRRLEACICDIRKWVTINYLKLNDGNTEFLPIVPTSAKHLIEELTINVGGIAVSAVNSVKNLGVHLDKHMDMTKNCSMIIRACYYHLHHISQINKFLLRKTRERVINALVTSRLDYCNSLLYGTIDKNFARLQRVQNAAARIIMVCPSATTSHQCSKTCTGCPSVSALVSSCWTTSRGGGARG